MSGRTTSVFLAQTALLMACALLCTAATAQSALDTVHIATPADSGFSSPSLGARASVIHTSVDLVLVPVSVTDEKERLVLGLRQENFTVRDGKHPQLIRHFSSEDAPVSVGVIVDTSGSMADKIERAREAVHQFCETSNPIDEFFLITFSDESHLVTGFTHADEIEQQLLFAQARGRTALLDAIYLGLRKMREAKYGKKALLIISDGGDNHSRFSEDEVKSAVKEADVMIYAIGTFDRYVATDEELLGPTLLSEIAEVTGGRAFVLDNANDMPALAKRIGSELRTQYLLGYRPEEVPRDGKWHKVSVKLRLPKSLPFFRVHARAGYYSAGTVVAPDASHSH